MRYMTIFGPMLDTRPLFPEERRDARAAPIALCRGLVARDGRPEGTTVRFVVSGPAGGHWCVARQDGRWRMAPPGGSGAEAARITMGQADLWRLATRGITAAEGRRRAELPGDPALAQTATSLLAVVA